MIGADGHLHVHMKHGATMGGLYMGFYHCNVALLSPVSQIYL